MRGDFQAVGLVGNLPRILEIFVEQCLQIRGLNREMCVRTDTNLRSFRRTTIAAEIRSMILFWGHSRGYDNEVANYPKEK